MRVRKEYLMGNRLIFLYRPNSVITIRRDTGVKADPGVGLPGLRTNLGVVGKSAALFMRSLSTSLMAKSV